MNDESALYCRGCYTEIDDTKKPTRLVSVIKKFDDMVLGKMLMDCTGLNLSEEDMANSVLCTDCKYQLFSFQKFRLKVHETDIKFKEQELMGTEVKVEVKVESFIPNEDEEIITAYVEEVRYSDNEDDEPMGNTEFIVEKLEEVSDTEIQNDQPQIKPRIKRKYERNSYPMKTFASPMDRLNPMREKIRVERTPRRKESLRLYKRNDKGLYECPKCPSTFSFLGRLELHLDIEHGFEGVTSFPCTHCDQVFPFFKELKFHVDEVHTPRPYICDICGRSHVTYASMKGHILRIHLGIGRANHGGPSTCTICGKTLATNDVLSKHIKYRHTHRERPKPYECSVCGSRWSEKAKLNKHIQIHFNTMEYECDRCGKKLSSKYGLQAHISYVHDSERNWSCEICGKSFKGKHTLQSHKNTHSSAKPFSCDICGSTFKSSTSVRTHKRLRHMPQAEAECEICHKVFKNALTLKGHMSLHTNPDLKCDYCDKTYKVRDSLNRHIRAFHKGIKKRHRCKLCNHNLWSRKHIEEHVEQMHKEYLISSGIKAKDLVERYSTNEMHDEEPAEIIEIKQDM